MEKYGINVEECSKYCQHALAASATSHANSASTASGLQFQIQGNQKASISALLVDSLTPKWLFTMSAMIKTTNTHPQVQSTCTEKTKKKKKMERRSRIEKIGSMEINGNCEIK
ncbi:unnamed protein product [Nesidiocoris tenuis]|uniref:SUI1 domain-containing protein n=1 Tax=Nesidiocoris tenuis TaxID=355587 RepID=A0A6H5HHK5_9HEMI|nr:unnamed protein product [Nesidiocoris tenuis]CAB0016446.1 unnamed protein product [Nesidiocoris tenuis]